MNEVPNELIDKRERLERFIAQKEIHFEPPIIQQIGPDWVFKVLIDHEPTTPSMYFEGTPVIFQKSKNRLSKR